MDYSNGVWQSLEKVTEQLVLNHELNQAEILLKDSIRGIVDACGTAVTSTSSQTDSDVMSDGRTCTTEEKETQTEATEKAARTSLDSGVDTDVDSPPPLPPKLGKPTSEHGLRCSCAMQAAERRKMASAKGAAVNRKPSTKMLLLPWVPVHTGRASST